MPRSDPNIAVFLGPSLPLASAREVLDARYLPPAGFGDVHALMGSDVHTIVLIDGVFLGRAPVWPREFVHALYAGVRIYGASSMGALRATELRAFGMIGVGEIYQAYVNGEIDGDDEVALLHADADDHYRALSEPLINVRLNLGVAVERGILVREAAMALIADLKALAFWQRSADAVWKTPTFCSFDEDARERLRCFHRDHAIDWKARDAEWVLQEVNVGAERLQASMCPPAPLPSYHDHLRLLERRFSLAPGLAPGVSIRGRTILERLAPSPTEHAGLRTWFAARFFVLEWARERGVELAASERARVDAAVDGGPPPGLTRDEHRELLLEAAMWRWVLREPAELHGASPTVEDTAWLPDATQLGRWGALVRRTELVRALPFIAAWTKLVGACPEPLRARARHAGLSRRGRPTSATRPGRCRRGCSVLSCSRGDCPSS
jgi:hypothetical protein